MRYLVISETGEALGIAHRLSTEGHHVNFLCTTSPSKGAGLVDVVRPPRPLLDRDGIFNRSSIDFILSTVIPDIIVIEGVGLTRVAKALLTRGLRVIGGGGTTAFANNPAPNYESEMTFITWFNGNELVGPYSHVVCYDTPLSGNLGPKGLVSGVVAFCSSYKTKSFKALKFIEDQLKKTPYRGPIEVHIVGGSVVSVTYSFTSSLYPTLEAMRHPLSTHLLDIVNTTTTPSQPTIEPWVAGVSINMTPRTSNILGINDINLRHIAVNDIDKRDGVIWAMNDGRLGMVTARGSSIREATKRVYRTINKMEIPGVVYRNDIGQDTGKLLNLFKNVLTNTEDGATLNGSPVLQPKEELPC